MLDTDTPQLSTLQPPRRHCSSQNSALTPSPHIIRKATGQSLNGDLSRALQTLGNEQLATTADPSVLADLRVKHSRPILPVLGMLNNTETLPPAYDVNLTDVRKPISRFSPCCSPLCFGAPSGHPTRTLENLTPIYAPISSRSSTS